jgi:hypothetical protein
MGICFQGYGLVRGFVFMVYINGFGLSVGICLQDYGLVRGFVVCISGFGL